MHWFRDLPVSSKIALLLAFLFVNLGAAGAVAVVQLRGLERLSEEAERGSADSHERIRQTERALFRCGALVSQHFAELDRSNMEALHRAFLQSAAALDELLHQADEALPHEAAGSSAGLRGELGAEWAAFRESSLTAMALGEQGAKEAARLMLTGENRKQFERADAGLQNLLASLKRSSVDAFARERDLRAEAVRKMSLLAVLNALLTGGLLAFLTRRIAVPLRAVAEVVRQVASGDLTRESLLKGRDEIGALGRSVDLMSGSLRQMVSGLADHAGTVATSSHRLTAITGAMAGKGRTLIEQAAAVSGAAVELATFVQSMAETVDNLSANIRAISGGAQDTSARMSAVNGAVDEINGSIARIAGAADAAGGVAREALERSGAASGAMRQLGEAAREIGAVTEAIKRIAHQTNLLALNASIEAASAGKAGAGFAVVANAIKVLARQSALSAGEIATRIASIQERAGGAIGAIAELTGIIEAIDRSVQEIAAAVSEQGQAAAGITVNILEAAKCSREQAAAIAEISRGSQEMAVDLNQASLAASVVSSTIDDVHRACGEVAEGIASIAGTTTDLARAGTGLETVVNQFQTS